MEMPDALRATAPPAPLMAGELHDISVAIGALSARMDNGEKSRANMHTKMDLLIDQTAATNARVSRHEERLNAVEPKITALTDLRIKLTGAVIVLTGAWYLGGSFVTEAVKRWWAMKG